MQVQELEVHSSPKAKKKVTFKDELVESSSGNSVQGGPDLEKKEVLCDSSSSSEDEKELNHSQEEDLSDYILARDHVRRQIKPPSKYEDTDLVAYALACAEEIEQEEPRSFAEAKQSKD